MEKLILRNQRRLRFRDWKLRGRKQQKQAAKMTAANDETAGPGLRATHL